MNRLSGLVALWATFAAASVGVGFGAAGLVGTPFADTSIPSRDTPAALEDVTSTPGSTPSAQATNPADATRSPRKSSKSASPQKSGSARAISTPESQRAGFGSSEPRSTATRSPGGGSGGGRSSGGGSGGGRSSGGGSGGATVTRDSVSTGGGYVSGSCQSGLIALSASPAVGWELDHVTGGRNSAGEAEFEQVGDGEGKVKVTAWCASGQPAFDVENDEDNSGGDDG